MWTELLLCSAPMAFLALGLNEQFHEDPDWPPKDSKRQAEQETGAKPDPLSGFAPLQERDPEPHGFAPLQPGSLTPQSPAPQAEDGFRGPAPQSAPQWMSNPPREASPAELPEYPLIDNDPRWKQINALNHAVEAGVLTEAEGDLRRRSILAVAPPPPAPDPETVRRKRAAILSALDAEIISREEADAKLSALPQIAEPKPVSHAPAPELAPGLLASDNPPAGVEPKRAEDAFSRMRNDAAEALPAPYLAASQQPPAPPADEAANARALAADALRSAAAVAKEAVGSVWHAASSTAHQAADKARDAASSSQWQQPAEPDPYTAAIAAPPALPRAAAPVSTPQAPQPIEGPTEAGDARGRFRLQLPFGWTAQDEAGTLRLTFGDAWAIFETSSEPGRPIDVAQRHAEKMRPFYTSWKIINGGPFTTKRQRQAGGWTITASWASNNGPREAVLLVWSVNAGSDRFLTMTSSADSAVAQASNASLMAIFDSVRFAGE